MSRRKDFHQKTLLYFTAFIPQKVYTYRMYIKKKNPHRLWSRNFDISTMAVLLSCIILLVQVSGIIIFQFITRFMAIRYPTRTNLLAKSPVPENSYFTRSMRKYIRRYARNNIVKITRNARTPHAIIIVRGRARYKCVRRVRGYFVWARPYGYSRKTNGVKCK